MSQNVILNVQINNQNGVRSIGAINTGLTTTLNTINEIEEASQLLNEQLRNTARGTVAFEELSQQLNVVNTELRNAELNLEVLDNEQLVGSVKGLAGGLTDIAGGLTLIGVSGEGVEKIAQTFAQVEGASKVIGGALDVYNEGMKVIRAVIVRATAAQAAMVATTNAQTVATTGLATAQTVQGNATGLAAIKMKALNVVMNANPVFLLITGVGLLAGALYLLGTSSDSAKEDLEELQASIESTNASFARQAKYMEAEGKANIARAKLRGASEAEIALIEKEATEVAALNEARRLSGLIQTNQAIIKNTESTEEEKSKAKEENLQYDFEQQQAYFTAETQATLDYNLTIKDINDKAAEERKKEREKELEERKKNSENLLNAVKRIADEEELYLANTEEDKLKILFERSQQELQLIYDKSQKSKQDKIRLNQGLKDLEEKYLNDVKDLTTKKEAEKLKIQEDAIEEARKLKVQQNVDDANIIQDGLDKANDLGKSARQIELQEIQDYYFERIELAKKLYGEESEEYLKLVIARGSEEERIKEEQRQEEIEKEREKNQAIADLTISSAQQTVDIISQILSRRNEMESFYRDERFSKDDEALKNSLANRLITQEEYDAKVTLLNQKKREEEKKAAMKAFQQQKAIQIANATIQGAQAVLSAFSSGAAVPIIGPATGAIYAGIAGAFAATQIALIASQKFTAARGGVVPGSGPSTVDSVDALLAPGEMVINANSARMFAPILSDINQAGGGIPLAPESSRGSNNGQPQLIEAYVVENKLTATQKRVARFERRKEF